MGFQSYLKAAVRACVLATASFAVTGCLDYTLDATQAQLASLYATKTPTTGFVFNPSNTNTPTFTPTATFTPTPTITNTPVPVAASIRLEVLPTTLVNNVNQLGIGRCIRVNVVSQSPNFVEFPVSTATSFAVSAAGTIGGSVAGLVGGFFGNSTCTTASNGVVTIAAGASRTSLWMRGAVVQQHVLTAARTAGMALGSATASISFVRDYAKLTLAPEVAGSTELPGGKCYRIRATTKTLDDQLWVQPVAAQVRVTLNLNLTAYSAAGCAAATEISGPMDANGMKTFVVTIAANASSTDFWIQSRVVTGTASITAMAEPVNNAITQGALNLTIVPAIVSLRWSITTQPVVAGVCSGQPAHASAGVHTVQVAELRGYRLDGVAIDPPAGAPIVATIAAPAGTSVYATNACGLTVGSVTVAAGAPGRVWVRAAAAGTTTVTATAGELGSASFNVVAVNGPSASRFKTPFPSVAVTECSEPLEIEIVNALGQVIAANTAGGGNIDLPVAGLSSGSKLYRENDPACLGTELASVPVAATATSGKFRLKAALNDPPTNTLTLSVNDGPLKTATGAQLMLARKDLEADKACLNQAQERAGRNTFRMITNNDEVAYTTLRLPNGKYLVGGDSTDRPTDVLPAISHGAMALIGADCRLSVDPAFFATTTGYHVILNATLYPDVAQNGTGIRKLVPTTEAANAQTGVSPFYAVGYANRTQTGRDVFVAKYKGDGTLDTTYGESTGVFPVGSSVPIRRGWFTLDLGSDDVAMDAVVVGNRLVVIANSGRGNVGQIYLLMFDNVGTESVGRASIQFPSTKVEYGGFALWNDGTNLFALVGGTITKLSSFGEPLSSDWFVSKNRITTEGFAGQPSSPAVNFGSQQAGDDDRLSAIAVQTVMVNGAPRTGVVMAGHTAQGSEGNTQNEAAFARLRLPGLELDLNQGSQNPAEYFQNNSKLFLTQVRNQFLSALVLDGMGRVLGFGREVDGAQASQPYVARLQSNGDPEAVSTKVSNTFDFGGTRDAFYGAVARPDNKTFVVGATGAPNMRQFLISIVLE